MAAALLRTCAGFVAPAMTEATAGCEASHASASFRIEWIGTLGTHVDGAMRTS